MEHNVSHFFFKFYCTSNTPLLLLLLYQVNNQNERRDFWKLWNTKYERFRWRLLGHLECLTSLFFTEITPGYGGFSKELQSRTFRNCWGRIFLQAGCPSCRPTSGGVIITNVLDEQHLTDAEADRKDREIYKLASSRVCYDVTWWLLDLITSYHRLLTQYLSCKSYQIYWTDERLRCGKA